MVDLNWIADILTHTPAHLTLLLADADPQLGGWKINSDEWCINEVIGHLIDADKFAFEERIGLILREEMPAIPRWDAAIAAELRGDRLKNSQDLILELRDQRKRLAQFVQALRPVELERQGVMQPYGSFKAKDFVVEWAYHDLDHLRQIMEIFKAAMWDDFSPTMQNALRD